MQQILKHRFFNPIDGVLRFLRDDESLSAFEQRQAAELHRAIELGNSATIQALLDKGGAHMNMIDESRPLLIGPSDQVCCRSINSSLTHLTLRYL